MWSPRDEGYRDLYYTTPLHQLYAMREALSLLTKETLQRRWARVSNVSHLLTIRLEAFGLKPFVTKRANRLLSTMTYKLPPNVLVEDIMNYALTR